MLVRFFDRLTSRRSHSLLASVAMFTIAVCLQSSRASQHRGDSVRLSDDSDWWSLYRNADGVANLDAARNLQARSVGERNFSVLGIPLTYYVEHTADATLGVATPVFRGDASTGRTQTCYISSDGQPPVHLIYERGEVEATLYLFRGGASWKGDDLCVRSPQVTANLATASGIHLGQSQREVIAILGKPSTQTHNELEYILATTQKTSPTKLAALRKTHPQMSADEFDKSFAAYSLGQSFNAKFDAHGLTYFAASLSETN